MATPAKKPRSILSFFKSSITDKSDSEQTSSPIESQSTSSTLANSEPQLNEKTANTGKKAQPVTRQFQDKWLRDYSWLLYDREGKFMKCKLCTKHGKKNGMSEKNTNFRTTTLLRHAQCNDHKAAVLADSMQTDMQKAVKKALTDKESAAVVALKSVFWLVKENVAIAKYESLLKLLSELNCPDVDNLKTSKSVDYSSDKSAIDLLNSLAFVAREKVDKCIEKSPFVSLLCDESTDISVEKKLIVYARVLDPETFKPDTLFVSNIRVESATGEAIYTELKNLAKEKGISPSKIMALGSDGAKVMTGKGKGVTGYMLRDNPMMVNYHCLAHKLALVTSQAANEVPYLVEYQTILTGLFYFFKASAKRCDQLAAVQQVLDEPILKVKEVHEVRWLSTYIAVKTIYSILDSLITYFTENKDAKAKGYNKKVTTYDFIASTYLLMDVLPVVSQMCLVFQKADLDVSQVKVEVEHCKRELNKIKTSEAEKEHGTCLQQLHDEHLSMQKGKLVFKGNHVVTGKKNIIPLKEIFIDRLLEKIDERFPDNDSNIIYAFAVLGMRPLTFLSSKERDTWGNDKIDVLIKQYGTEKVSTPTEDQPQVSQEPLIDERETKAEWSKVKQTVVDEGYPRDKIEILWRLINKHHADDYPNLLTLASLALTAPIHTSDCERGFSAQNQTKTPLRNRLNAETVQDIMTVKVVGGKMSDFNFNKALEHWKCSKERKLFH